MGDIEREYLYWWYTLMLDVGPDVAAWFDLTTWLGWLIAMGACGKLPCWV